MAKVLYTTSSVQKKVISIMADNSCKRTIVVAFVGDGAEEYIGDPKGINLICWPQPGSTNPKTLQYLIKKGVRLGFCDKLHMKIYSSNKHGTVLGSSNLTNNGLGGGNLREAGVYLAPDEFSLENALQGLKIRKPTKDDFEKLFIGYHKNIKETRVKKGVPSDNFGAYITSPFKEKFKIEVYDADNYKYSDEEIEAANLIGKNVPEESIECYKNDHKVGDWLLAIEVKNERVIKSISWMHIEAVVRLKEKSRYVYRALQLRSMRALHPPFMLTPKFKTALFSVCRNINVYEIASQAMKPASTLMLRKIEQAYRSM